MAIALLFVMALPASHAAAAPRYWVTSAGGTFNQSNWSTTSGGSPGASVPGVGDNALFNLSNTYTVTFSGNASSDSVYVISGTVTFMSSSTSLRIYQVIGGDADLYVSGNVGDNATLNIGAANPDRPVWLNVGDTLNIGTADDGTVVVSGNGSRLDADGNGTHYVALYGATGMLTYQNGSAGTIDGTLEIGVHAFTSGHLNVLSDADLTVGNLVVGTDSSGATGDVTVDGPGSTLVQTGASTLTVGAASGDDNQILVGDGGVFSTGTGEVTLNAGGTIRLDGGTFNLNGPVTNNGGAFSFIAGELDVAGSVTVGDATGLISTSLTMSSNRYMTVPGTTTIAPFHTLTLDGGALTTSSLAVNGTLDFRRGTLGITGAGGLAIGAGGPLGAAVTLGAGQTLNVTNTATIAAGASLLVQTGGSFSAATLANSGNVVLDGVNSILAGNVINNDGTLRNDGTITAATLNNNGVVVLDGVSSILAGNVVSNDGTLRGDGTITAAVNNLAGGEIRAENGKTLLFTAAPGANAGQINLQGGTAEFSRALTNAAGGRIIGRGTLITGGAGLTNRGHVALSSGISDVFGDVNNAAGAGRITISGNADVTFWDDVTSGGALFRVSAGSSATFFGTLAGAGVSGPGDVFIEADITPGFSPGTMAFGGDVSFGPLASVDVEIGGLTQGTQHDQVTVAGDASLAGTLNVDLINGFTPAADQSFVLMTYGSHTGQFSSLDFPPLSAGLSWTLSYHPSSLVLSTTNSMLPGDIDLDGDVDRTDAALFTQHLGTTAKSTWTTGDFNADGATTLADLNLLQANFGQTTPSPAAAAHTAIPEPGSLALVLISAVIVAIRRRAAL